MKPKFEVGQTAWMRISEYRDSGFRKYTIKAIEKKSYIIEGSIGTPEMNLDGFEQKISFVKAEKSLLTDKEYNDLKWKNAHGYQIRNKVNVYNLSADQLKQIAVIVGYKWEDSK